MDAIQFTTEIINAIIRHGWSLTTLTVAVMALLRVNGVRRIILRRLPKRFRYEDKLERVERKIDALSAHMGVPKCDLPQTTLKVQLTPLCEKSTSLLQVGNRLANRLRRTKRKMGKINKAILLPLLAALGTFLKQAFGVEVTDDQLDMVANIVLFLLMLMGIFMNPKKPQKREVTENDSTISTTVESAE
jgi:uncharacterized membrane protein